jgi:hypothetical protein
MHAAEGKNSLKTGEKIVPVPLLALFSNQSEVKLSVFVKKMADGEKRSRQRCLPWEKM